MPETIFHFPRGFLWGTATSAHQVEGNNTNTWSNWETSPGRIIDDHESGSACDWWGGKWREDMDRVMESGQNSHRLSIEWSRIQPKEGVWDESALDKYRQIIRGLTERGILPLVTLHHFSDPIWVAEQGGWENRSIENLFQQFVSKVVEALQEYVNYWITINEPNVFATFGYLFGDFPPGKKSLKTTFQVMENLVRAHAAAYHAIHELQPAALVGTAINYRGLNPARNWSPFDRFITRLHTNFFNDFFPRSFTRGFLNYPFYQKKISGARNTIDFLGINYFTCEDVSCSLLYPRSFFGRHYFPPEVELSENGFIANQPEGIFEAVKWGMLYKKPIIITENGVEDSEDLLRPRYLVQHLHQLWRAVNFNCPVKGYYHWSLIDNFEWERGWTQRFGLWELENSTQIRIRRPSADLYSEICQENGISSSMVSRYTPELLNELFPN